MGFHYILNPPRTKPDDGLTLYITETHFNTFANRTDPDQAALVRAACSGSTLFAYGNMIYLILR